MKKFICTFICVISAIYSLCYASIGGFVGNKGALSKIGLTHPVLFIVWGVLTFVALTVNICVGFAKTKYKFYIFLILIALVGIVLTVLFDFDYNKMPDYYLHCAGSLTFSAVMGITVLLLFVLSKRWILSIITGCVLFTDLMLLIVFKETAVIELFPIFCGYVMLCLHNCKERGAKELAKR